MKKIIVILALSLGFPAVALAHGKSMDEYGCHWANKNRHGKYTEYHCHRGPMAGHKFKSQKDMLHELRKRGHHHRR